MPASDILSIIVLVAAAIACGLAVWALIELARAMRSVRTLSDDTRVRLVPLLEKADVAVDALNAELLRIDGIVTTFEEAGERVSSASGTISGIVAAPGEIVSEAALRMRRAWRQRRQRPDEAGRSPEASAASAGKASTQPGADLERDMVASRPVRSDSASAVVDAAAPITAEPHVREDER